MSMMSELDLVLRTYLGRRDELDEIPDDLDEIRLVTLEGIVAAADEVVAVLLPDKASRDAVMRLVGSEGLAVPSAREMIEDLQSTPFTPGFDNTDCQLGFQDLLDDAETLVAADLNNPDVVDVSGGKTMVAQVLALIDIGRTLRARGAGETPQPEEPDDEGENPYGECASGHEKFRGGCPDCAADMVVQPDTVAVSDEFSTGSDR